MPSRKHTLHIALPNQINSVTHSVGGSHYDRPVNEGHDSRDSLCMSSKRWTSHNKGDLAITSAELQTGTRGQC